MDRSTTGLVNAGRAGCVRPLLITLTLSLIAAAVVVLGVLVATEDTAHAGVSSSQRTSPDPATCWAAWQHPHGADARACRDAGWVVQQHLVVNRNRNAGTDLPPCPEEDSAHCYWNARIQGNGYGHSFVNLGRNGRFSDLRSINGRRA